MRYGHVEIVRMLCGELRSQVMVMHDHQSGKHENLEDRARKEGDGDMLELLMTLSAVWDAGHAAA